MTVPLKDPVCGMTVRPDSAFSVSHNGQPYFFCSEFCRRSFLAHPGTYAGETASPDTNGADLSRRIAYFSMEVGLDSSMPTYSGGLGVLAHSPGIVPGTGIVPGIVPGTPYLTPKN